MKMKDSGVEWIGEIPEGWEVQKVKYSISISNGSDPKTTEGDTPVYGSGTESFKTCKEYKKGPAVLLGRKGSIEIPRYIHNNYWNVDTAFDVKIKGDNIYLKLYYYYAIVFDYKYYLTSTTIPSMTQTDYGNMSIPLPPKETQQKIATYLDEKCSQIEQTIQNQQQVIEKLKAYKHSLITEAVTGKVKIQNGKVTGKYEQYKDSGVKWIGEIPSGWERKRIIYVLDEKHPYPIGDGDHGMVKTEDYVDDGIPYIRVQNLGWCEEIKTSNIVYITEDTNKKISSSILRPGDVLFAKTGATIGKTGIVPDSIPICNTTSHVGKISVSKKVYPKYLLYFLSSKIGYEQFWNIANQKTTRPELAIDEIKKMFVIMPKSFDEQKNIAEYLEKTCSIVDSSVEQEQKLIEKLTEYKKSLIYECVTGKREIKK